MYEQRNMNANKKTKKMNAETTVSQEWGKYTRLLVNRLALETEAVACGRFFFQPNASLDEVTKRTIRRIL